MDLVPEFFRKGTFSVVDGVHNLRVFEIEAIGLQKLEGGKSELGENSSHAKGLILGRICEGVHISYPRF